MVSLHLDAIALAERLILGALRTGLDTSALRQVLTQRFSTQELRILCSDMGMDYNDLPGEGKAAQAFELVLWFQRRERLNELIAAVRKARPGSI